MKREVTIEYLERCHAYLLWLSAQLPPRRARESRGEERDHNGRLVADFEFSKEDEELIEMMRKHGNVI